MGQFVDEEDLRRPVEFPRIAERRLARGAAIWMPPSRRKLFKGSPAKVQANIIDLSFGGALLTSEANPNIKIGNKIRFAINGAEGVVEVRTIRPANDRTSYYGVSFFRVTDQLRAEVFDILGDD